LVSSSNSKREEFDAFETLFDELRDDENKFFNYFRMSDTSFYELHRRLKESLHRRNNKIRNCIQPVKMVAVAIRKVMFVYALKEKFDD
jgi:hypothetical protein